MATGTRSNSNLGQDENKQMLLKLQAEMASRFQQSEERMQNIEEKFKAAGRHHTRKRWKIDLRNGLKESSKCYLNSTKRILLIPWILREV